MIWGLLFIVSVVAFFWVVSKVRTGKAEPKRPADAAPTSQPGASGGRHPGSAPSTHGRAIDPSIPFGWFGRGTTLHVGGFTLRDPCVYASHSSSQRSWDAVDPSEILIGAPAVRPRSPLPEMGYWPWYSRIEPAHRYLYLEWLAGGKTSLPAQEGLLFLYYYGLERRILVDEQDRELVLREVVRLRRLDAPRQGTPEGRSFRSYTTGLLWYEVARDPQSFDAKAFGKVCDLTERWSPEYLSVALSWLARHDQPLPPALARRVAQLNPRSVQSVVVKRITDEFDDLFAARYSERHPGGLRLKVSKRPRRYSYRPASAGLDEVNCTIADPTGIPSQFEPLADLWNECIADLRRLSRIAVPGAGPLTVEAWEATPDELRGGLDHPLSGAIQEVTAAAGGPAGGGGESLPSVAALAPLLQIERRPRLTASQSRRLAQTLEQAGFAIEPDARITGRTYGWDEIVAVYLQGDDPATDTTRYLGASCMLHLGLVIAQADGHTDEEELRHVTQHIESSFQLSEPERRRIDALRAVLLVSGADLGPIAQKLQSTLPMESRQSVGRLLVAIAAFDGIIDKSEESALRKCYRALGLSPDLLERTIADLAPDSRSDLVTVQGGGVPRGGGERLPPPPTTGLKLDRAAISAIMAETKDVAIMLARAMEVEEEDDLAVAVAEAPAPPPLIVTADVPRSADGIIAESGNSPQGRYGAFYRELIERERWSTAEADELARRHGLMLAGAVETINDWAFDALGGPVLDDAGGEIIIDRSLL